MTIEIHTNVPDTTNINISTTASTPSLNMSVQEADTPNVSASVLLGPKGEDGRGIVSVIKTGTKGLVDTYTITFTDGTTSTFNLTNGEKGDTGNAGVQISTTEPTDDEIKVWINPDGTETVIVSDVKVNGTSVVTDYVANIDLTGKQDVISDLATIRTNATNGNTAYGTIQTYGDIVTHNTSEFYLSTNPSGYITSSALNGYATETFVQNYHDSTKQDVIENLSTIENNASNGQSAYTTISGYGNIVTHNASEFYPATNPSGYIDSSALNGYATESFVTSQGYIKGITSSDVTTALGYTPYNSTNPNNYISGITSSDVTTALGYTPYNSTNPSNYISGITSTMVTNALGYTPYNSTNPNGYITKAVDDTSTTSTTLGWSASKLNSTIGDIETLLQGLR